ncbi:MAG TPA: sialidase family protein [Actinomycetota bacterium]|nr:sialidase family protein [Actinomycetota bacterium]
MRHRILLPLAAIVLILAGAIPSLAQGDTKVASGSPTAPFSQNKQNEPWLAIDPSNPSVLAAGANDNIDLEACAAGDPSTCPFTPGVGVSGVSFSFNGGTSWIQPTYTGYSARGCLGPDPCVPDEDGPIGTLPWYFENGLVSNGDPSLVFGPRPDESGEFSWANGSRLYYANLVTNFPGSAVDTNFKGFVALGVSRTDDVVAAAADDKDAWMDPVIISRQSSTTFSDKEAIWADNAESSAFFGNVYVCNVAFRSAGLGGAPEPVMVARSTDGGDTWTQRQISQSANTVSAGRAGGRQGCVVRSDSAGTVYVVWRGSFKGEDVVWMARSFNGGVRFDRPRAIAETGTVGEFDPVQRRLTFDGVAGARTNEGPTFDIANGAPTGEGAPDILLVGWADGRNGLNNERAMVRFSDDGGATWSQDFDATEAGDRPDFPWIAISPDGEDVYITYMGFLDPWRATTADSRLMQGVVRHADFSDLASWTTLHRGEIGDARGSSANGLGSEFLGDYDYVMATNDFAAAVWNDVRDAAVCPAINAFRQSLVDGAPLPAPDVQGECDPTFGNSDTFGAAFADPTP